jgi:RNB domain
VNPAVYVRSVEKQKQFYTSSGKWRVALDKEIDIVIKGFVSKEMIDTVLPYFPDAAATMNSDMQVIIEGGVPRSAAAPLIAILQKLSHDERKLYKDNATTMDNLYSLIASSDERQVYSLHEIAAKALNTTTDKVTPEALFMTHKAILRIPFLILIDRSSIFTHRYAVHPEWFGQNLRTVWEWVRDHQDHATRIALQRTTEYRDSYQGHPMQKFLSKAKRLIAQSRGIRSPTTMASVGPSAQRLKPEETHDGRNYKKVDVEDFSSDDKKIIDCLLHCAIPPFRGSIGIERYAAMHIMRATGMYTAIELQRGAIPLFLQELGVFPAWENIYSMDQFLALPGHNIDPVTERSVEAAQQAAVEPNRYENDVMADSRIDWGDLPIYCIDDPGAKEIDDGISLEPVPGSNDTFWLRVHIANPSAFVPHDDPVSHNAAERLSTVYLPERHYPMLPQEVTHQHFSLAQGRPTFTISAKVNLNGIVLETNIANGRAQNVIYITHRKLRSIFDTHVEAPQTLTIGGDLPAKSEDHFKDDLTNEETETFLNLRKIMNSIHLKWKANGGLTWSDQFRTHSLSIHTGKGIQPYDFSDSSRRGGYYLGDPIVSVSLNTVDPYEVPDMSQRNLVSLVMQFACHTAGRWAAERNIPLVYDGAHFHPEYPALTPEKLQNATAQDWLRYAPPKGHSSSSVLAHSGLGVDAYTKTTSPLRRYTDLLAHYQIEAALRYEQKHGQKFDGKDIHAASSLPFSTNDVNQVLERMKLKYPLIKVVQSQSNFFWACHFLFRAFYFGECELPETMPCLVRQKVQGQVALGTNYVAAYSGENLPFNVRARLHVTEEFKDLDLLGTVEAKIVGVNMAQHVVDMEVVRKVKGWERTGDWA